MMKPLFAFVITLLFTLTTSAQHVDVLHSFVGGRFEGIWSDQAYAVAEIEGENAGLHLFTVSSPNSHLIHIQLEGIDFSQGCDISTLDCDQIYIDDSSRTYFGREHSSTSLIGIPDANGVQVPYIVCAVTPMQSYQSDIEVRLYNLNAVINDVSTAPEYSFRIDDTGYWSVNSGIGTANGHFVLQAYYAWGSSPRSRSYAIHFTDQGTIAHTCDTLDMPLASTFKRHVKLFQTHDSNIVSYNYISDGSLYRMIIECQEGSCVSGSYSLELDNYTQKHCIMKRNQAEPLYIVLDQIFADDSRQLRKQTLSFNEGEFSVTSTETLDDMPSNPLFGHPRPTGTNAWSCPIYFSNGSFVRVDIIPLNSAQYGHNINDQQLYPGPRVFDVEYCAGADVFALATGPSVSGHNPEPGSGTIGMIMIYDDHAVHGERVRSIPIRVDASYTANTYGDASQDGFAEGDDFAGIYLLDIESEEALERVSKVHATDADGAPLLNYRSGQIEKYRDQLLFYSNASHMYSGSVGQHPGSVNMISCASVEDLISDLASPQASFLTMSPYIQADDFYLNIEGWRDAFDVDRDSDRLIFITQKRALQVSGRIPGRLCQLQFAKTDYRSGIWCPRS
jgi:hypothetical protein